MNKKLSKKSKERYVYEYNPTTNSLNKSIFIINSIHTSIRKLVSDTIQDLVSESMTIPHITFSIKHSTEKDIIRSLR